MDYKTVNIDLLVPYAYNTRTHSDEQVAEIASSIKEFGWTNPVLIDAEQMIIAGHGRVMAARKLGITDIPCISLGNLTDVQKKAYIIADNKLALNAGWDMDLLALEIEQLKVLDFDIDLLGFDADEVDELFPLVDVDGLTDEDEVPDVPEVPTTKLGDIYQLGDHRLMCGDSTSIDAVEGLMDGQKADMVFTDPPYGINMQRSGSMKNDTMDVLPKLFEQAIANIFAVSKGGASIYLWVGFRAYSLAEKELLKFRDVANCIVWKKPSIGMGKKGFRFQHELCLFSGEVESNSISDVWEANRDTSGLHPTIKPIELVEKAVVNSSKSGDFLIDLFGGSGSTLIACEKTARHCYLMELDPKYCNVIIKRWQDYTGKTAVHAVTGQAFAS